MAVALARRHVLVVDDDPRIRDSLSSALRDEGHLVSVANHGVEGLARLRSAHPPVDVVLLDLMMPIMSGWAFRLEQRGDPTISHVPVVVLSADGSPQAAAIDAAAYLRKPFALERLLDTIDQVTARSRSSAPAPGRTEDRASALQSLSAALTHEIANPLAYTLLNVEELATKLPRLDDPDSAGELAQLARDARHGARRIAETLEEVRQVATASSSAALVREELGAAARAAFATLDADERARVELVESDDGALPVLAPPGWLPRITSALMIHGVTHDGGTVRARCERRGGEGTFVLRTEKSLPSEAAAGIRLVLCNMMVVALGGRLASTNGEVTLALPLAAE